MLRFCLKNQAYHASVKIELKEKVYIRRLRRTLSSLADASIGSDKLVQTVGGAGYRFTERKY